MKNEGPTKVVLASPPIGDKHEMCVDRSCGVNQLFNTICNLEGVLPDSLFIQLETQNLPEVLGKGNVLEPDGPDEQPCHLPHAVAAIATTHAGDQETLVGAQGSILDEALYRLAKEIEIASGGDGVTLALYALTPADDGTEVLQA